MGSYKPENTQVLAKHFGLDSQELIKVIYETDSFIAGGAVLGLYLNNKVWDDSDLDIFYGSDYAYSTNYNPADLAKYPEKESHDLKKFDELLIKSGYFRNYIGTSSQQMSSAKPTVDIEYTRSGLNHFIKRILNYSNDDLGFRRVQIIVLFPCDIREFIHTFDLNICKLVLVAKQECDHFGYLHEYNITIDNDYWEFDLIHSKKMYVSCPMYPANLERRLIKYLGRGFKLINHNWPYHNKVIIDNYDPRNKCDCRLLTDYISKNFSNRIIDYHHFKTVICPRFMGNIIASMQASRELEKEKKDKKSCSATAIESDIESDSEDEQDENEDLPCLVSDNDDGPNSHQKKAIKVSEPKKITNLKFGDGYRNPLKYSANHKYFVAKTLQGYIHNFAHCPNNFFRIIEAQKLFDLFLAELDFINSDKFDGSKRFIVTIYKKALELNNQVLMPKYMEDKSDNERLIIEQFLKTAEKVIATVSQIKIPLGEMIRLL